MDSIEWMLAAAFSTAVSIADLLHVTMQAAFFAISEPFLGQVSEVESQKIYNHSVCFIIYSDYRNIQFLYNSIPAAPQITITKRLVEEEVICHVWGFYPEPITVSWFLNGSLLDSIETQRINSSAVEAIYQFTLTEKNQGLELSCEVDHDTLSRPLVRKLLVEGKGETWKPHV
uniref:Ig-like domain-containing protein n=1 Tax=Leptobrachium leishanense TaxID=445787 RepID=A0A8C5QL45_9ANUR